MGIQVEIKERSSGETRSYQDKTVWDDGFEYMWSEGNYACDCNRDLFFQRAGGGNPEVLSTKCGDDRFSVRISDLAGNLLYQDEE